MSALFFVVSFFLGKLGSVSLYQTVWRAGLSRKYSPYGALITFLLHPWPWLFHLPIIFLSSRLSWTGLPLMHIYICISAGSFSLGAIGRLGALDLKSFFWWDRLLVLFFLLGLWFSPVFLYPLLLTGCCLQYTVSGSAVSPGYSNLLGFEFMRSSLSMCMAGLVVATFDGGGHFTDWNILGVVLAGQAAGYVQQAVAKSALGNHWYSWILENRLQCLFVNAWLRGWCRFLLTEPIVLKMARVIAMYRIFLCAVVWVTEFSWVLILADKKLVLAILSATILFHLAVWLLTGLVSYHYLTSHLLILILVKNFTEIGPFTLNTFFVSIGCIVVYGGWSLLLRNQIYKSFQSKSDAGPWGRVLDPADHLMAWWDSPYMRMYSYRVKTISGKVFRFSVRRFSPYDTFLTDIHTHLMLLGRSWPLDPALEMDRSKWATGVWGIMLDVKLRNQLYAEMHLKIFNQQRHIPGQKEIETSVISSWEIEQNNNSKSGLFFIHFFQGLNTLTAKWWFRKLFYWPHFPGEDWVADISPLSVGNYPVYKAEEPVTEVIIDTVKTFFYKDRVELLGDIETAVITIPKKTEKEFCL